MRFKFCVIIFFLIIISTPLILCGCTNDKVDASQPASLKSDYDLSLYELGIDKILNEGTKDFFGNHPIDESFLSWFIGFYGEDAFQKIVDNEDYNNPNIWMDITKKSIHVLWYEYCIYSGIDSYENNFTYVVDTKSSDKIVFDITGDLSMAENKGTTNYMLEQPNGLMDCFDDRLIDAINESDVFVVNNEFSYTIRGDAITAKYYTFRGNPDYINELKKIGVDAVTLANNHVYDYSEEGFLDTLRNLEEYNLPYIGAGRNLSDAQQPIYYIANGIKIALVNSSQIEKNQNFTKAATKDEGGINKCLDPTEFIEEIKTTKLNADVVVAIVHWGDEYQLHYGVDQEELAHTFADAGADVIVGGHPHVLQGFDYIGDVPVYYSLGNFFFSLDQNMPQDYETGLAKIEVGLDGNVKAYFVPCYFSEGVIRLVDDKESMSNMFIELNEVSDNALLDRRGLIIKK